MAKRILIADDSVTIQKAFAMTFAGADDVTVSGARSADEGLALAQRTHPDLVIADGVMPGRSGYDLCASIKADPALRGGSGAHPRVQPAALRRRPRSESWRGRPADQAVGNQRDDGQGPRRCWAGVLEPASAAHAPGVPAAPPAAPGHRSAASLPTSAIDDDEYGEISIDTGRESIPTIPRVPAAPPPGLVRRPNQQPSHGGRAGITPRRHLTTRRHHRPRLPPRRRGCVRR